MYLIATMLSILLICLSIQFCESRFRIGQGVRANFDDWKFVVKLEVYFESANSDEKLWQTCTGTLVHFKKMMFILTAGHCFQRQSTDSHRSSNEANLRKSNGIVLFQGTIEVQYPIEAAQGGVTKIHVTFKDQTVLIPAELFRGGPDNSNKLYRPMDFALIKVKNDCFGAAKPQFLTDFEAIDSDDLFDQTCQTAGWGAMGTAEEMFMGRAEYPQFLQVANLMAMNYVIDANRQRCLKTLMGLGNLTDLPLCLVQNTKISEKPQIGGGDSGGPTFCDVNGKRKFAGVTSARDSDVYVACYEDGTKMYLDYEDLVIVAAPTNNIIKFISKHEWRATTHRCTIS